MYAESAVNPKSLIYAEKITTTSTDSLTAYKANARTHNKRQIKQIAQSIKNFGFLNPILIDEDGQIIAGHGRWLAAKLLGLSTVPTLLISHLTATEKRAYMLADNRLAELAGWDREILAIEFQSLIDFGFDTRLTGFETAQIDFILEEVREASKDEGPADLIPAYVADAAISQPGDLWQLGQHRLLCADAREANAYETLLEGCLATFVFADPPYNVPIDGHVCGSGRIRHRDFAMACGEMSEGEFIAFLEVIFRHLVAHTVSGSIHDICMDWRHLPETFAAGRSAYTELKNLCVWNKSNAGMGSFYRSKHELILVWKSGDAPHINNFELGQFGRTRSNVWDYPGMSAMQPGRMEQLAMHPTVKPVALVADAIKDCSRRGDIILDPFAGSGTVLIAAERTGRKAYALEIDPHYVDVAIKRWQTYTGKQSIHVASGLPFDEAETARGIDQRERNHG